MPEMQFEPEPTCREDGEDGGVEDVVDLGGLDHGLLRDAIRNHAADWREEDARDGVREGDRPEGGERTRDVEHQPPADHELHLLRAELEDVAEEEEPKVGILDDRAERSPEPSFRDWGRHRGGFCCHIRRPPSV